MAPAKVDRSQDVPTADASGPGFRESVESAMTLSPKESIDAVTRLLERGVKGNSVEDAAWFFEKYHKEHYRGQPRLVPAHWITVLEELARTRPAEAGRLLEAKERLGEHDEGRALMMVWASARPLDAIAWAEQGGKERKDWLYLNGGLLMTAWATHDLDGLLAWLEEGNESGYAPAAIRAFESRRGIAAVREWLETFGGEGSVLAASVRMAAVKRVAAEIHAGEGRQAVMSWVESREDPVERWQALHQVLPRMVAKEAREAVEWLERLSPQQGFPAELAETSMNEWTARDLKAAGEWLNRHRGSAAADSYIWGYAVQLAVEDPAAALAWSKEVKGGIEGGSGFIAIGNVNLSEGPHYNAAYLEQIIAVTASAAAFLEDPDHPGVALDRRLALRYMPRLIRESPGAEPQLRMVRESPLSCTLYFDGKWRHPFPVYERQADGSLRHVPPADAE